MKLLIDAGNTRIKFGWLATSGEREPGPLALAPEQIDTHLPSWLAALPPLQGALGTSVASPALQDAIAQHLRAAHGVAIDWQVPQAATLGLGNGYRQPQLLGADRWLALVGLWAHPRHAAARQGGAVQVLATFGTATTIDTVTPDGLFPGGLILPGIAMMRSALAGGTARLPSANGPAMDWPDHTLAAIQTGILAAQWGAVARQLALAAQRHPKAPLRLLVAGGAWPDIADFAHAEASHLPALTLEIMDNPVLDGLAAVAADAGR